MPVREFDEYERAALVRASQGRAGHYLDCLGRTDLAQLHPEEWQHVCRLVIEDFGDEIKLQVGSGSSGHPARGLFNVHQTADNINQNEAA
ncbi:hypothetical protein AEGHOMDF_2676 [Methylobacterium soli]|nr:hypothetical protein AEGHOMDF_2676 [Methylobacterium soli]